MRERRTVAAAAVLAGLAGLAGLPAPAVALPAAVAVPALPAAVAVPALPAAPTATPAPTVAVRLLVAQVAVAGPAAALAQVQAATVVAVAVAVAVPAAVATAAAPTAAGPVAAGLLAPALSVALPIALPIALPVPAMSTLTEATAQVAAGLLAPPPQVPAVAVPSAAAPPALPTAVVPGAGLARPAGRFDWPLSPTPAVGRAFQPPSHPYGPGHRGADLIGTVNQPVLAAGDGTVVYAGRLADRGVVSVDHAGGLRTTYEPLTVTVRAGQLVRKGQPLGTLAAGHPGCPAAACLHWGLRREHIYLDPLLLVRHSRVRLLPWPPGP